MSMFFHVTSLNSCQSSTYIKQKKLRKNENFFIDFFFLLLQILNQINERIYDTVNIFKLINWSPFHVHFMVFVLNYSFLIILLVLLLVCTIMYLFREYKLSFYEKGKKIQSDLKLTFWYPKREGKDKGWKKRRANSIAWKDDMPGRHQTDGWTWKSFFFFFFFFPKTTKNVRKCIQWVE